MIEATYRSPDGRVVLYLGDCLQVLPTLAADSMDSIVTDPPYGLEFMGKEWDAPWEQDPHVGKRWNEGIAPVEMRDGSKRLPRPSFEKRSNVRCRSCGKWKVSSNPCKCDTPAFPNLRQANMRAFQDWATIWATELLRVAKPGAHLLAFGGTRTFHRLACAIEDAGWEIRDTVMWVYGSGFPKSLDVSKAIDKAARAEREVVGDKLSRPGYHLHGHVGGSDFGAGFGNSTPETRLSAALITAPATDAAREWQGWGTALKPAWEPIIVARKSLEGTVAANVLRWGTGAINVDACRVEGNWSTWRRSDGSIAEGGSMPFAAQEHRRQPENAAGRWPANLILSYPEDQYQLRDDVTSGQLRELAGWMDANA